MALLWERKKEEEEKPQEQAACVRISSLFKEIFLYTVDGRGVQLASAWA